MSTIMLYINNTMQEVCQICFEGMDGESGMVVRGVGQGFPVALGVRTFRSADS